MYDRICVKFTKKKKRLFFGGGHLQCILCTGKPCTSYRTMGANQSVLVFLISSVSLASSEMHQAIPIADNHIPSSPLLSLPSTKFITRMMFFLFGATYFAFQKKMLPHSVSRIAARMFFWPTVPFTFALRTGKLLSRMDETVLVGVAPIAFSTTPTSLYAMGVRGVINLCDEFSGPKKEYDRLGMEELWLPTVDHYEPSVQSLWLAIKFITKFKKRGQQVYVSVLIFKILP
jgi:hypothetical protein